MCAVDAQDAQDREIGDQHDRLEDAHYQLHSGLPLPQAILYLSMLAGIAWIFITFFFLFAPSWLPMKQQIVHGQVSWNE
jgi:hypothetical protein